MSRSTSTRKGLPAAPGIAAPADRRFRRADVPPQRRRLGRLVARLARRALPAFAVLILGAAGAAWLLTTSWLSVQHIDVRGTARLSAGDVITLAGDMRGENILRLSLDRTRSQIMASPWVGDAAITRVLPSTIEIQVTERLPMAVGRVGSRLVLVDRSGVVIDEYTAAYHDLDLPIVDGLVSPGGTTQASPEPVALTSALMDALAAQPRLLHAVSQVDVSNPHDAVVLLEGDPAWLHLGETRFVERLQHYLELKPTFDERFRDVDYVDLRFDQRIYVRGPDTGGRIQGPTQ
jgi:cell division protein FtsQ